MTSLSSIVHGTTYEALREVSPMLASRTGLSTAENPMGTVAAKLAELSPSRSTDGVAGLSSCRRSVNSSHKLLSFLTATEESDLGIPWNCTQRGSTKMMFEGKVALVTGSGMGLDAAHAFAAEGAAVALN